MAANKTTEQAGDLHLVCPWCGYSLEGLSVRGQCPECGDTYAEWMLRIGPSPPTPRWVRPAALAVGLLCTASIFVYYLFDNGLSSALFACAFVLAGVVPSLILILAAAHGVGKIRGPNASGVVAGFGLCGPVIGGPGAMIQNLIELGYVDPFLLVALPFLQVMVTFLALSLGVMTGMLIPISSPKNRRSAGSARARQHRLRIAKRFAHNEAGIGSKARQGRRSKEDGDDRKTTQD